MKCEVINKDCVEYLIKYNKHPFDLSFLDPPFNQKKEYRNHNDSMDPKRYWDWMDNVCRLIRDKSSDGASLYFMQREKNTKEVMEILESSGWIYQNLIIWKKKTSAIPSEIRFGKHYQIIVFATKGKKPRIFNKLRIDPPLLETETRKRESGVFVTDVWDDIRELTSGYFAGDEPLRENNGDRFHKQQSPIHLLTRIILSSSNIGDYVFDPFLGTGTTLIVSKQLERNSVGVEIDKINCDRIIKRINFPRKSDDISRYYEYYRFTGNLEKIWGETNNRGYI